MNHSEWRAQLDQQLQNMVGQNYNPAFFDMGTAEVKK